MTATGGASELNESSAECVCGDSTVRVALSSSDQQELDGSTDGLLFYFRVCKWYPHDQRLHLWQGTGHVCLLGRRCSLLAGPELLFCTVYLYVSALLNHSACR